MRFFFGGSLVLVLCIAASMAWAQGTRSLHEPYNDSEPSASAFSPQRWAGAHWIEYFHDGQSNDYYTYKAAGYLADFSIKFAVRGKDGHYAAFVFVDEKVQCDPKNGARTHMVDLASEDYRADGTLSGPAFNPAYVRERRTLVPGSSFDIVSKAVCAAVIAAHGNGHAE